MMDSGCVHVRTLSVAANLPGTAAFDVSPLGTMAIYD